MTHDTCARPVSFSCRKSPAKKAIQVHTGQMSSKTTLIGLIFFGVSTKNPFMEDLGSSPRTSAHPKLLKILPSGANLKLSAKV